MLDLHRRTMRRSVQLVDLIADDQWELPTPCTRWTLRQLVEHMTRENRGFAAAAAGAGRDRTVWTTAPDGDDLRGEYARSADLVVAAFAADGVLEREFWLLLLTEKRPFAAAQAISFHLLDYVVHGWDVATALGRPPEFDEDLVHAAVEIAEREVPDTPRRAHPDAAFRPPVPVPATAPALDRLVAMLGRSPRWPD